MSLDCRNAATLLVMALVLGLSAAGACAAADGAPLEVTVDARTELGTADLEGLLGVGTSGRWTEEARKAWLEGGFRHLRGLGLYPAVEVRGGEGQERSLHLDFEHVDRMMAESQSMYIVPGGFSFNMPQVLSSKPDAVRYDDEVKDHFFMYVPADYQIWDEYVRRTVEHIVKRWGQAGAYYEIFNEPDDYVNYFKGKPGSTDYLGAAVELYVHTARAIKAADPSARIGGPSSAHWKQSAPEIGGKWGPEEFVRALIEYNKKHPEAAAPLDFVAWHDYAWLSPRLLDGADYIDRLLEDLGWPGRPEYLITEWNLTFGQPDGTYTAEQFSSHHAYNLITIGGKPNHRIVRLYLYCFDFYAGEYVSLVDGPDYYGSSAGREHTWARRPAYAVFQMARLLHGGRLLKVSADTPLVAMASKQGGKLRLMVNNNTGEPCPARIELTGMSASAESWDCHIQQVDGQHSSDGKGLEAGSACESSARGDVLSIQHALAPYGTALFTISERQ